AFFDYDNDGWLDLLTVNGGVAIVEAQARAGDRFPYRMTNQLFRNAGNGRFEDVTARAGVVFDLPHVGRGAAFGDIDNDGDTDVLVGNDAGPVQLLVNTVGQRNRWIGVRLIGNSLRSASPARGTAARPRGRDMLGARVGIVLQDGRTIWRRVRADGSYASANDPRVLVGLGAAGEATAIRVRWPDGRIEQWKGVPAGRYTTLEQGTGVRP
ncbi:MAG TPA: CRTAC1 family protein, partial [Vicinamibacterales bacterium]|nr:CRTAC1 family protein [Vicinamibacterales bacterium]